MIFGHNLGFGSIELWYLAFLGNDFLCFNAARHWSTASDQEPSIFASSGSAVTTHQDSSFVETLLDCTSSHARILSLVGLRDIAAAHTGIHSHAYGLPVARSSRLLFTFLDLSTCFSWSDHGLGHSGSRIDSPIHCGLVNSGFSDFSIDPPTLTRI
jgi:hypothetical protein